MTQAGHRGGRAAAEAGTHRISRLGLVNEYLVAEDDGLTLIDTGLPGTHRLILARARDLGLPIKRIALTHGHGDHRGALDALVAALPGVRVIMSEREAGLLAGDNQPRDGEPEGKLRGGLAGTAERPTQFVADGDVIGSLRVVATPGHTPGHLAFLDTRDGTLYAGDAYTTTRGVATSAVVPWRYPMAGLATWDRDLDLASARLLRDLAPDRLASGHGPVISAPGPAMTRAIEAAARKMGRPRGRAAKPPLAELCTYSTSRKRR
jgi:glyoxylase-like metal-dependent hydrolase (beta-lactamase superfamily II)